MPITLHDKYAKQVDAQFTHDSYLAGKASNDYEWTGVKTIKVMSVVTQPTNDYTRTGTNRYGTPIEVEDTVQEMSVSQDKSFSLTVDKGNYTEQSELKEAGKVLKSEMNEQVVPEADRHVFNQWVTKAGTISAAVAPTKSTVIDYILEGRKALVNARATLDDVYLYPSASVYKMLLQADDITKIPDLGKEAIGKGVVGKLGSLYVVEVPDDVLPSGVHFLIAKKASVLFPKKIWDTKLHLDPPGISGNLLEGRFIYDGFVRGQRAGGVYASVLTSLKVATPTYSAATVSCATSGATLIYTSDGSDPRYSTTAAVLTGSLDTSKTNKIYATKAGMFTSDVLTVVAV